MSSLEQPNILFETLEFGRKVLGSSEIHSHKFYVSTEFSFSLVHSFPRQDHTPRVWISRIPRDEAISWGGPVDFINIKKMPYRFNVLVSKNKKNYLDLFTFLVTEGTYYLNIQNLENFGNGYTILS